MHGPKCHPGGVADCKHGAIIFGGAMFRISIRRSPLILRIIDSFREGISADTPESHFSLQIDRLLSETWRKCRAPEKRDRAMQAKGIRTAGAVFMLLLTLVLCSLVLKLYHAPATIVRALVVAVEFTALCVSLPFLYQMLLACVRTYVNKPWRILLPLINHSIEIDTIEQLRRRFSSSNLAYCKQKYENEREACSRDTAAISSSFSLSLGVLVGFLAQRLLPLIFKDANTAVHLGALILLPAALGLLLRSVTLERMRQIDRNISLLELSLAEQK
jgi:hypothetical protein